MPELSSFDAEIELEAKKLKQRRPIVLAKTIDLVAEEFKQRHRDGKLSHLSAWNEVWEELRNEVNRRCSSSFRPYRGGKSAPKHHR